MLLAVYRIGCNIPTPGIDAEALMSFFAPPSEYNLRALRHVFRRGFGWFSVFALGIMPYISASIFSGCLRIVVPAIEKLYKEGEAGQKKIKQYTRYGTVVLSAIQGLGIVSALRVWA